MSDESAIVREADGTDVIVQTGEVIEKTPEDLLLAARDAAQALERVIQLNDRPPVMFNGKRYLEFHHWQVCAKFYHVTVRTLEAVPCEIDGQKGFKAKAEVIDEKTGLIVGGAEAYCFRDEPNWAKKPLFQLASMAQTRAASKALANKFRFVAIVAGYEGTPSEEMIGDGTPQRQVAMPRAKEIPQAEGRDSVGPGVGGVGSQPTLLSKTSETPGLPDTGKAQSKFFTQLHARAREKKVDPEKMKKVIAQLFHKESSKDLLDSEAAVLIRMIEEGKLS